ncbi:MAG: hypothetical protein IJE43_10355, partial [Alphaproteobacteria bacterium]|nr:hypothetical protein [Alphaproteobacteria bacterium]
LLMIPNIVIAVNVILSWFYYFTDYQYWLDNFTLHEWEGYPDINTSFLLKEATYHCILLICMIIGNYLIIKGKKIGLLFLAYFIFVFVYNMFLGKYNL